MLIPRGDWIVVERHIDDTRTRGEIIKGGLTERGAKMIAARAKRGGSGTVYNYWAMERKDY
jgi:hypothetical protein